MEIGPRLIPVQAPTAPEGIVVVLHGGATRGPQVPVDGRQLSVLRMIPTARAVARASSRLAVHRLLNTYRGWDEARTPLEDVAWAIDRLAEAHPGVPVGLVGHSLGGRTALLAAEAPEVRAVVALNPWVYSTDDADLTGRRVLIVHGDQDRIASIDKARAVARNLERHTPVEFVVINGGKHAMIARGREFDGRAATFLRDALDGKMQL